MRSISYHQVERAAIRDMARQKYGDNAWNTPAEIHEPDRELLDELEQDKQTYYQITPITYQVLPCPICHRSGRHMTRIYRDQGYEINTCLLNPKDQHSWRVDYDVVGKELYQGLQDRLVRAVSLINDMQSTLTKCGYSWGKHLGERDRKHVERLGTYTSLLRQMFDAAIHDIRGNHVEDGQPEAMGIPEMLLSDDPKDYRYQVSGREYIGERFFTNEEDGQKAAADLLKQFFIRAKVIQVSPVAGRKETRWLLALPVEPKDSVEGLFMAAADEWVTSLSIEDFPKPDNLMMAMLDVPAEMPQEIEPEVAKRRGKVASADPTQFERNYENEQYRGIAFCQSQAEAKYKAKVLRRDFMVHTRSVVVSPSIDFAEERYLVMVPASADEDTWQLMELWLEDLEMVDEEPVACERLERQHPRQFRWQQYHVDYMGLVFMPDAESAKCLAKELKRQFDVSVRSRQLPKPKNIEGMEYVIMIPEQLDSDSLAVIRLWLDATISRNE